MPQARESRRWHGSLREQVCALHDVREPDNIRRDLLLRVSQLPQPHHRDTRLGADSRHRTLLRLDEERMRRLAARLLATVSDHDRLLLGHRSVGQADHGVLVVRIVRREEDAREDDVRSGLDDRHTDDRTND